jgi:hypothetical protein
MADGCELAATTMYRLMIGRRVASVDGRAIGLGLIAMGGRRRQ